MKGGIRFGIGCSAVIALLGFWYYDSVRDRELVYAVSKGFHGPIQIEQDNARGDEIERHWSRFVFHIPATGIYRFRGRDPLTEHWWHVIAQYEGGAPIEIRDANNGWPLNGFPDGTPRPGPNTFGMYQVLGCGRWTYFVGTLHECKVWVKSAQAEYQRELQNGD